ncbi:MAG: Scr1 family TA system antitoxin-like transcriptional regulator [Pseudonocardiaceae bacterium]
MTARLARQLLFNQERPARFTFDLHESVLHTLVGSPAVMSDQLHHFLRMSVRSHVTVRVVPAALGAHAAIAGSSRFMEFTEFRLVTYLESTTTNLFLERPEETAAYRRAVTASRSRGPPERVLIRDHPGYVS